MLASRTVHATMDDRATAFAALIDRGLDTHYRLAAVISATRSRRRMPCMTRPSWWRGVADLRDRDRFEAWFGRILVNGCRDRLPARRRRPIIVAIPALGHRPTPVTAADQCGPEGRPIALGDPRRAGAALPPARTRASGRRRAALTPAT